MKMPKSSLRRKRRRGGFGVLQEFRQRAVKHVIFTQADMDLLRLLRWCRHVRPEMIRGIFAERDIQNLMALGLTKLHGRSGSLVLTAKGRRLLNETLSTVPPDTPPSYRPDETLRRLRVSALAVTAYRAQIQIFTIGVGELFHSPALFLPVITRGRGHNPWGNTRVAALANLGGTLYDMHFVCPGIGKISLTDELTAFNNHAARFQNAQRAFIFAGESYGDIFEELASGEQSSPNGKLTFYGEAYQTLRLPVHLLSCNDTGVTQLQIMAVPNYRSRLTRAVLKAYFQPPPKDVPAWDAIYQGRPFTLAVDMDLRRIDTAIQTAKEHGWESIAIAALKEQGEGLLLSRYRGMVQFYALTRDAVAELIGYTPVPYTPPRAQFLTEKGDVVDAPLIKAAGKAGRPPI